MSLTQYIREHAPLKEAFAALHDRDCRSRAPANRQQLLVPQASASPSFVGTAFDYLARWQIAARTRRAKIKSAEWVAEFALGTMRDGFGAKQVKRWTLALASARECASAFNQYDIEAIARHAQMAAHLDYLVRYPDGFNPSFAPTDDVTAELVALASVLSTQKVLVPRKSCLLNPGFTAASKVGGADADLLIDDTLVEIKVQKTLKPSIQTLRQLAGYVALHRMGGFVLDGEELSAQIRSVAMYSARYGALFHWDLQDLFPADGLDKFCKVFEAEIRHWRADQHYRLMDELKRLRAPTSGYRAIDWPQLARSRRKIA